jgi:tetratricopeptide (TPR) repeat protein/transcriptional regulator with XRE-family HTH domain
MSSARNASFADLLRHFRRAAGLSQEELALRAGLSRRAVSDLERDRNRMPRRDTVGLLAGALGLVDQEQVVFIGAATHGPTHAAASPRSSASQRTPVFTTLIGRMNELASLQRLLVGEGPSLLLFAGEPGAGKTRLLQEAAQRAHASGWRVLTGGCTRRSAQASYAPFTGALAHAIACTTRAQLRRDLQGCAWLGRLLPELAEQALAPAPSWKLPPEQERRLLFAAVCRYLANVAGPSGTLVILDDLQWAGGDALDLLESLVRESAAVPTLLRILGAYRDTEVQPSDSLSLLFADLARDGLATQRSVGALDQQEARVFAELLLTKLDDGDQSQSGQGDRQGDESSPRPLLNHSEVVEQIVQRAGGVPFFLVSCALGLRTNGSEDEPAVSPTSRTTTPEAPSEQAPWQVTTSIRQRVAALPHDAQLLLGALAVAGRSAPFALLAAMLARPKKSLLHAVEAACHARLLEETHEEAPPLAAYQFTHDLIRETVFHDLSAARRAVLHRAAGLAIEKLGFHERRPVELAYHFAQAEEFARALPYALLAGDQAVAVFAHAEAEEYYRSTIALARKLSDHLHEATALERLGLLLDTTANMAQAREALEQAIQAYQAAGDQEGLRRSLARLIRVYMASGLAPEVGLALLEPFLPSLLDGEVSAGRGMLRIGLARLYEGVDHFTDQLAEAEQAKERAHTLGEAALEAEAEHWRSHAFAALGRPDESVRVAEQALPLAAKGGDLWEECFLLCDVTWAHVRMGTMWQCQEATSRAVELALRMGLPGPLTYALCLRSEVAFHLGDWRRARDDVERALALVRPLGTYWIAAAPRVLLGRLCLAEGQWESGRRYVEEGLALAAGMRESVNSIRASAALGRAAVAETDLLSGRADRVIADLEPLLDKLVGAARGRTPLLPSLAWAYLDVGDPDRATGLLQDGLAHAQFQLDRLTQMEALLVQARVAIRRQRWAAAQSTLESALSLGRAMRSPYAEAKALSVYGLVRLQSGEPEPAREQYEAALAICDRLGEGLYRKHIERELETLTARMN